MTKFFSPPPTARKVRTPSSHQMGVPGTQPKIGKTRPQATMVAKEKPPRSGFSRKSKPLGPGVGKEVVPRAQIVTRAKPTAEY